MNKVFAIATADGRPYRLIRVAALAAIVFGVFWLAIVLLFPPPDLARASQQAAELQAIIRQQPQLAEVRVDAMTNGKVSVIAREDLLSAEAKSQLEHLVAQHAPAGTGIMWLAAISKASATPNAK